MGEPLQEKDMIRGVIVNADEYKTDEIISPNKIEEVWVNLENLKSVVELLKEKLCLNYGYSQKYCDDENDMCINCETINKAFPYLQSSR